MTPVRCQLVCADPIQKHVRELRRTNVTPVWTRLDEPDAMIRKSILCPALAKRHHDKRFRVNVFRLNLT